MEINQPTVAPFFRTEENLLPVAVQTAHISFTEIMNTRFYRDHLMNYLLKSKPLSWFGSWFIIQGPPHYSNGDEIHVNDLDEILDPLSKIAQPSSFTLAITKGLDYAHFTSYILIPPNLNSNWNLISFNSGYGLYRGGEETIEDTFKSIEKDLIVDGVVPDLPDRLNDKNPLLHTDATISWSPTKGDRYEEFCRQSGSMQCTGDPFCQTWSLLFIFQVAIDRNLNFIDQWSNLSPSQRLDLIHQFILDILISSKLIRDATNRQIREVHSTPMADVYDVLSNFYGLTGTQFAN